MAGLALIPLLGNFTGAFIGAYVSRLAVPYAVATGLMGKGVAEIALLLVMWGSGIIDEVVFSFLVLVMFCYILFMPSVINFAVGRASRRTDLPEQLDDIPSGIVRFALEDITIDDILDRSHRHPTSSVTVREFTDQWIVPRQPHYVVADKEALSGSCLWRCFAICRRTPGARPGSTLWYAARPQWPGLTSKSKTCCSVCQRILFP